MTSAAIELPPPLALAASVESLDSLPRLTVFAAEPKWDGYRCCVAGGRIFGRRGTNLTRYFPDLAPLLSSRLPASAVIDGELVAWDVTRGRLDFAGLQARLTSGRRIGAVAARRPAQLVCFDLLASGTKDLRPLPLAERRQRLARLLSGQAAPIVLCQQTDDPQLARDWLATLGAGGVEGLIIKDAAGGYPTQPGKRIWWKIKSRHLQDMVAIGIVGDPAAPTSLILALPRTAGTTQWRAAGATTVLSRATARALGPLIEPTGETWPRMLVWASSAPTVVHAIEPLVVEVSADEAIDHGVLRHPARLIRVRADLAPTDLELD